MSIIAISSRLLRRPASILIARNLNNIDHNRPKIRFRDPADYNKNDRHDGYGNLDEPVGALGYIMLGVPILTFLLGTWQVERRKWKVGLIDELQSKVSLPPRPFPEDLSELNQMEYCPVKVRGTFLYDREFAIGPKSRIREKPGVTDRSGGLISVPGNTGFHLITPFKVENRDVTILVNRGWIPKKPENLPKEKLAHLPGTFEICGIVRLNEERQPLMPHNTPSAGVWVYRDLLAMAFMAGTDPVFLDLTLDSGVPDGPIAGQTRVALRNEHTSYIITWYTLSILTAWMWHRLFIRKLPLL